MLSLGRFEKQIYLSNFRLMFPGVCLLGAK